LKANLISSQRELKCVVSREFFCNTATGTGVTTKSMVDYKAIQKFITEKNLNFITCYTKVYKPVKAVIRHLPGSTSAEDITVAHQEIDYKVISVKHMNAKHPTAEGGVHTPPSSSS
jgi:hypothetical protein